MKVLFAHSFFMAFDDKQRIVKAPYPPLATLIAAAGARQDGHTVNLFDAMTANDVEPFGQLLAKEPFDAFVLFEDNFNWLSKMCLLRMREAATTMIEQAKKKDLLIVVAGSDASDFPEVYLKAGADYVIKGEAEFRLLELLDHHAIKNNDLSHFSGPGVFRDHGDLVIGEPALRGERNLSRFPAPAWDLVDMETYRRIWQKHHNYFSLNMVTTRGCPYRCNWCAKPIHGRRYDVRDPHEVAAEMHYLKREMKPDHIWFADDIFGLKPGWIERFADEIERLDGRIPFMIQARADLMKPKTVAALARAGCQKVWMGVESGSQKILDAMDKDLSPEHATTAARLLKEAGIQPCFFLQFGYPGETAEDIRLTWDMVQEARPAEIGISVAYPLPGTPFYEKVKDDIGVKDHWLHSQDMRPIFKANYPSEFYPELYQYIHQLFSRLSEPNRISAHTLRARWRHLRTRRRLKRFGVEGIPFR